MSSDVVILARGISKRYDVYDRPHHRFMELVGGVSRAREFWAVRDVDMQIRKGETVGIVGRNGSGKSTLLQLLCGTLEPTNGELAVKGRVAALLELGAGFNPDFTGLENVYLNASLMGLSREETDQHLDDIVAFADIGDFLRQPVRTYSSGMYVRLAFAVAIAVEPDILVVDEALAVGDEAFQRKCYARIEELKAKGAAVLFVSHSAGAVVQLCDRALLMEGGRKLLEGAPKAVVGHYQRLMYAPEEKRAALRAELSEMATVDDLPETGHEPDEPSVPPVQSSALAIERFDPGMRSESVLAYASRGARIVDPHLVNTAGERVNVLVSGGVYRYRYDVRFDEDAKDVHFGMMLKSLGGVELFGMSSHAFGDSLPFVPRGAHRSVEFSFRADVLPGAYFLNAGCVGLDGEDGEIFLHRIVDALMFRIEFPKTDRRYAGLVDFSLIDGCRITARMSLEGSE
jgi:lipopolysaccharide transport system ATP-binding protein